MRAMADDWEAGGPVRTVCAGYEDAPPGAAIQLRLLAGVFRHQRLAAALRIAADHPVRVDAATAGDWLAEQLEVDHDGLTVVWQSITQLYWPRAEVQAVDALVSGHGRRGRLARVAMEFPPDAEAGVMPDLRTTVWSGPADARVRTIGTAHYHGLPVRLRNV